MSEPNEPTPELGGTITPEAEPTPGGTPAEDYQKRYEDLRPQYDRTQNELNALKAEQERIGNDPEAQRALLVEWGYEFEEPEAEPPADLDELRQQLLAELRQEIEPVKQTQAQIAQDKELEAAVAHQQRVFAELGDKRGAALDESEQDAVTGMALTMAPDENGMPPFKKAFEALEAIWQAREAKAAQKRRPSHKFTPGGVAGDEKPDLSTHEGRVANAMAKLADTA